ncbi:MAG: hypothetical protein DRI61_11460 [Chloroflexi bacterium]|nr:MAG: hypothetical protein DRI61_11460 [Chloroflexota bacterium]
MLIEIHSKPLIALDANVFLGVLIPHVMKMGADNIAGAERALKALDKGDFIGLTSVMAFAEIRWAFARHKAEGFEIARYRLERALKGRLLIVEVTTDLAVLAAELRAKYYSKRNDISYNDGLYLATALQCGADLLLSSDPHLLNVSEMPVLEPKEFPVERGRVINWVEEVKRTWLNSR